MVFGTGTCDHDGGTGIGAGHRCICNRKKGHPLNSDRPHGCGCGAMWEDSQEFFQPDYHKQTDGYLTQYRTLHSNLKMMLSGMPRDPATTGNHDYDETWRLMRELEANLAKYKRTGSIKCKNCKLVASSHGRYGLAAIRGCPGWRVD